MYESRCPKCDSDNLHGFIAQASNYMTVRCLDCEYEDLLHKFVVR